MSIKSRYQLSMLAASLFQLLGMISVVIFMHDAVHATDKIPATFALFAVYCQIFATAFFYTADYLKK